MTYAVIRVRGRAKIRTDIEDTLKFLRLTRVNHCTLIPNNNDFNGMLQKVKDYVTWGEINNETLKKLLITRGKLVGNKPLTEKEIKKYANVSINDFVKKIINDEIVYSKISKEIKPIFRLHPPKQGYENTKRAHVVGGSLGYRGEDINNLILKMLGPGNRGD